MTRWRSGSPRFRLPADESAQRERAERARRVADACWVPPGETAEVHGHRIGSMVYVGEGLMAQSGDQVENCLIDPALPVATRIMREAADADYEPSYADISPSDRLGYLRWLSSSRSDPYVAPPFLRLYFFGLERRLMLDDPSEEEREQLIAEVNRLLAVYGEEYGLDDDMDTLLECAAALFPERLEPDPERLLDYTLPTLPLYISVGLGYRLALGQGVTGRWLLSWWLAMPGTKFKAAEQRIFDEFASLFEIRLDKRYPSGLKVDVPAGEAEYEYRAASGSFTRQLSKDSIAYPPLHRIRKPLRTAKRLAGECWKDLARFSRFVVRKPHARKHIEGHVHLPTDLAVQFPNKDLQRLHAWAAERLDAPGESVTLRDALRAFDPENPNVIRKHKLVVMSSALALGGYGIAPDARFTGRLPGLGDRALVFPLAREASAPPAMSPLYQRMLAVLLLVIYVARAGGRVTAARWQALDSLIQRRPRLRAAERSRLKADVRWLESQLRSTVSIKKRSARLSPRERDEVCEMAVKVACADLVGPAQVQAVQRVYQGMGRAEDDVFANLHRRSAEAPARPAPVRRPARLPAGFAMPGSARPGRRPGAAAIELDSGRISEIVADTRKVSRVLADVFEEDGAPPPGAVPVAVGPAQAVPPAFNGLDASHSVLVAALVGRPSWSEREFEQLARHCGLLPGGALEAVNEWAFERFGEALLEEDDDLALNIEILHALRSDSQAVPDAEK